MNRTILSIQHIKIEDSYSFSIAWSDGSEQMFNLWEVQKHCPCAGCANTPLVTPVNEKLTAKKIVNVGSYAIKIFFSTGCCYGIYDYPLLRTIGKRKNQECLNN